MPKRLRGRTVLMAMIDDKCFSFLKKKKVPQIPTISLSGDSGWKGQDGHYESGYLVANDCAEEIIEIVGNLRIPIISLSGKINQPRWPSSDNQYGYSGHYGYSGISGSSGVMGYSGISGLTGRMGPEPVFTESSETGFFIESSRIVIPVISLNESRAVVELVAGPTTTIIRINANGNVGIGTSVGIGPNRNMDEFGMVMNPADPEALVRADIKFNVETGFPIFPASKIEKVHPHFKRYQFIFEK